MKELFILVFVSPFMLLAQSVELKRFTNPNARQAVAVDDSFIYVINNSAIDKVSKETFQVIESWVDTTGTIPHLNSGIIINDTLYCASSNYPKVPMTSTVEKFTTSPLKHIGSHSFGIFIGSCTWVLRTEQNWWAFFAHYENKAQSEGKGVEWSTLVKFDENWTRTSSWTLPDDLLEKLRPYSLSGGVFVTDKQLLTTGHHDPCGYLLDLPNAGSELRFKNELKIPVKGQGIAHDPQTNSFWGIDRSSKEVVNFTF